MGRLVRATTPVSIRRPVVLTAVGEGLLQSGAIEGPEQQQEQGSGYLERVAKYVPAEIVGFFLFVNNILDQAFKSGGGKAATMAGLSVPSIAVAAFVVGLILTPIYIYYVREEGDAWKTNAFVSTLAFPVWAYAMGAVALIDFRDGNFASILLATFTVCSGLIRPPVSQGGKPVQAQDGKTPPKQQPEIPPAESKTPAETAGRVPSNKQQPPPAAPVAATSAPSGIKGLDETAERSKP